MCLYVKDLEAQYAKFMQKGNLVYIYAFSIDTKPVNIHFRALHFLVTQAQDIHWISTGLQNTMDICTCNHLPVEF